MLATLVIFLREGVEASMIVAILLAYLNRIGRRDHFRDVFAGVGAALVLATAGGVIAYETISSYDGSPGADDLRDVYLPARGLRPHLHDLLDAKPCPLPVEDATCPRRTRRSTARPGWGLALLAFQAVGREGLETVVFTLAIVVLY